MATMTKNLASGILLAGSGIAYTGYALLNYPVGAVNEMGPGMFPVIAGSILGVLGAGVLIGALVRPDGPISIDWGPFAYIVGGLLVFAVLLPLFGFVPAVSAMTLVLTIWNGASSWRAKIILAVFLPAAAYIIFYWGLGVRMTPFRMPLP